MKLRKIIVCLLAVLVCQTSTILVKADDKEIKKEDVINMTPGWGNKDKAISDFKVTDNTDSWSLNADKSANKNDDNNNDDKNNDEEPAFDMINNTDTQIVSTSTSTGNRPDFWAKTSDGKWMLIENGNPVIGWKYVYGSWYYMNAAGIMQTGWLNYNNHWYYLYGNGKMAHDTYVGKYYFTSSGIMR